MNEQALINLIYLTLKLNYLESTLKNLKNFDLNSFEKE